MGIRAGLQQCKSIKIIGEAVNGLEGIKLLKVMQPDVAIVDIGLPDTDGIELTQRLKALQRKLGSTHTLVLILSLQNQEAMILAAFAAGADSYCTKSAKFEQLLEALRLTHEGYCWIAPAIAQIVLQHSRRAQVEVKVVPENKIVFINPINLEDSQMIAAYPVTERELEVLELIGQGYSNAAIAKQLYISVGTCLVSRAKYLEQKNG